MSLKLFVCASCVLVFAFLPTLASVSNHEFVSAVPTLCLYVYVFVCLYVCVCLLLAETREGRRQVERKG